ncbi:orotate phosphoribosyltransferase [Phycisphaera mikurensis]|uniref:Orotate phosphoribosyltransferase n=1 Tax=Phycisphaera mikurensis (strain NBRC 102666 / KCTC 22515 / FYK2301M01) TaxID=1142394 RepID=I0IIP3_PHYMF|nr:orotate phosphoribosyltransferase [Phycisphaera mikurensis]MBB6442717.1 orotate phosphoribosyltransferase [Phycisphaera mikurensis]BAM05131.1 orotate phosphoribosyltransferase [Phycisphaera mikurensis NBRC 102666]
MTDADFLRAVSESALLRGDFTLRSGRKSSYYLDKYGFVTRPEVLRELAVRVAALAGDASGYDRLAGPELGGVPIATAVGLLTGKPTVFVRNAKKDYGTAKRFEGTLERGDRVVVTEDIATSGGQAIEAARLLRDDCGCEVVRVVVAIDREEGGREAVEEAGFAFASVLTKTELGID